MYAPLLGLALLIPRAKFGSKLQQMMAGALVASSVLVVLWYWSQTMASIYLPYQDYDPAFRNGLDLPPLAEAHDQQALLIKHPTVSFPPCSTLPKTQPKCIYPATSAP
ncbi:MAG: hypothetical protein HC821_01760 [Lewinella sp.]|nr:hypothetical protein [Lewinella sp.]